MTIKVVDTSFERDEYSKGLRETNLQKAIEYQNRRAKLKGRFDEKDAKIEALEDQVAALWDAINNLKVQK